MDFILEDIDWRKILIRRYKNYHLNENDLAVILLINELNRGVPHLISPEEIVPYTTMNDEQIEQIMSKLLKAGYASIEGVSFSVNAIKKKIFDDTVKEASLAKDEIQDKTQFEEIYHRLEVILKRQITALEYDVVTSWSQQNMSLEQLNDIINTLKTTRKKLSIAIIDKEFQTRRNNAIKIKNDPKAEKILGVDLYNKNE